MSVHPNPPAFAAGAVGPSGDLYWSDGMLLRDWLAGQAVNGMLASEGNGGGAYKPDWAAERAYQIADAMLAERAKGGAA